MSNCAWGKIREIPESSVSETVCMNLSGVCGGTYNGSLLEKLNASIGTLHCNVWKRTRHLIASSEIHFLSYCQWFLVLSFLIIQKIHVSNK